MQESTGGQDISNPLITIRFIGELDISIDLDSSRGLETTLLAFLMRASPSTAPASYLNYFYVLQNSGMVFRHFVSLKTILGHCKDQLLVFEAVAYFLTISISFPDSSIEEEVLDTGKILNGMSILDSLMSTAIKYRLNSSLLNMETICVRPTLAINDVKQFSIKWSVEPHEIQLVHYSLDAVGHLHQKLGPLKKLKNDATILNDLNLDFEHYCYFEQDPFSGFTFKEVDSFHGVADLENPFLFREHVTKQIKLDPAFKIRSDPLVTIYSFEYDEIHVARLKHTFDVGVQNELEVYEAVGRLYAKSDVMKAFVGHVLKLKANHDSSRNPVGCLNTPFVYLGAPSRTGKTSMLIALDFFAKHKCFFKYSDVEPVFSFCVPFVLNFLVGYQLQNIYRTFDASNGLSDAVVKDWEVLGFSKKSEKELTRLVAGDSLVIGETKYLTVGFIVSLLTYLKEGLLLSEMNEFTYVAMTIKDGREAIRNLSSDGPIIISLDEFNVGHAENAHKSYFVRNVAREMGPIVALAGTDIHAPNLLRDGNLGPKLSVGPPSIWTCISTEFPAASAVSVFAIFKASFKEMDPSINTFIEYLDMFPLSSTMKSWLHYACHSRPGFVRIFFEIFHRIASHQFHRDSTGNISLESDFSRLRISEEMLKEKSVEQMILELCLSESHKHLRTIKDLSCPNGQLGQLLLLYPRDRVAENGVSHPASLIHGHFAELKVTHTVGKTYRGLETNGLVDTVRIISGKSKVKLALPSKKSSIVGFASRFPEYPENEIFYLMLLFSGGGRVLDDTVINLNFEHYPSIADFTGKRCASRDGYFLESISTGVIIYATHSSLSGVPLNQFILNITRELLSDVKDASTFRFSEKEFELLGGKKFKVPFIPCANATSSEKFRALPFVYTGTFLLAADAAECDGIVMPDELIDLLKHLAENQPAFVSAALDKKLCEAVRLALSRKILLVGFCKEDKNFNGTVIFQTIFLVASKLMVKYEIARKYLHKFFALLFVSRLGTIEKESWEILFELFPTLKVTVIGNGAIRQYGKSLAQRMAKDRKTAMPEDNILGEVTQDEIQNLDEQQKSFIEKEMSKKKSYFSLLESARKRKKTSETDIPCLHTSDLGFECEPPELFIFSTEDIYGCPLDYNHYAEEKGHKVSKTKRKGRKSN